MQHAPRFDTVDVDPLGLKPKLAMYANSILSQLWHSSPMKNRIVIGKHKLGCPEDKFEERYTDGRTGWYDGVHMFNRAGKAVYTESLVQIIKSVIPALTRTTSDDQTQARHRNKKTTNTRYHSRQSQYIVPTSNKFDILGN